MGHCCRLFGFRLEQTKYKMTCIRLGHSTGIFTSEETDTEDFIGEIWCL